MYYIIIYTCNVLFGCVPNGGDREYNYKLVIVRPLSASWLHMVYHIYIYIIALIIIIIAHCIFYIDDKENTLYK